ncbi:MAG: transketolase family protein [Elusimicrobia bacterium]|nr:transketolase family protein [Elusimicrobiota bacterium]
MHPKSTRVSFGETIAKIAETNPQVVVLDADLGKSTMTGEFAKKFPDRYFEIGIAEQNMIGTAAGLAMGGKIPFATSFACFLAGRFETIRMSVSYPHTNVKLVGTHAGVAIGEDGYSQMGLEDIAVLRSLPNLTILQPADELETAAATEWAVQHSGSVYLRLTRQKVNPVHTEGYRFNPDQADILRDPKESRIAVLATGGVVYNSLKASEELEKEGILVTVANIHTIKPLDEESVRSLAKKRHTLVTIEDHNVIGGLGSAVSEVVASSGISTRVIRLGMKGFGQSGSPEELYEKFGLSAGKIKEFLRSLPH